MLKAEYPNQNAYNIPINYQNRFPPNRPQSIISPCPSSTTPAPAIQLWYNHAQVYDFVRYLQRQSTYPSPITAEEDDWLEDSEEQMQAEDALWDASHARHQDKFAALAAVARAEIDA